MAFDFIAMFLLTIVYVLVRWALSISDNTGNGNVRGSSSTFNIFRRHSATVEWGWTEPMQVGETMSFQLKFFGLAGTPRNVDDVRNLKIEIMKNGLAIAHIEETPENDVRPIMNGENDEDTNQQDTSPVSNAIKVSFTVRASGVYSITIYEDGRAIAGSPHEKTFIPGPPVASRTTLVRALNSSTIVAIAQNQPHVLTIEPRDEYGNMCANRLHARDLRDKFVLLVTEIDEDENEPIPVSTDLRLSRDNLIVDLFVPLAGCFHAVATYEDRTIGNGEFDLVVLTASEMAEVEENIEKRNLNVWFEAKLLNTSQDNYLYEKDDGASLVSRTLSMGDMPSSSRSRFSFRRLSSSSPSKSKVVYCSLTPKQIVVKEYFLRFIPRRLQSFRLCQATKIIVNSPPTRTDHAVITISDGCQPAYMMSCEKCHMLIATFVGILNKNIGGSDSFEEKVKHFRQELLSYHKLGGFSRGKSCISVKRETILQDSYRETKHLSVKEWCRVFQINFEGELGVDWGGLNREWVTELCKTLFVPKMESTSSDQSTGHGDLRKYEATDLFRRMREDNQALVLPNPCSTSGAKLKYFEFAGKLVGKCLLDSAFERDQIRYISARFARSFLAQIIGLAVTFRHFESDDPELYKSKIRYIIENDVADFDLCFAEEEYHQNGKLLQVVPLKPNGVKIKVTNDNKLEYLNRLAQYKLSNSVKQEMDAFNKGLNTLVPEHLLSVFDENELELVMCGSSKISVDDMRRHCHIEDRTPPFVRTLGWFWAVISSFTQDELAMLLQFVTGCSQLPPGGFAELSPRLKISYIFYHSNNLPTAHTCFNELCLPSYDSYDKLHKMLKLAITEGAVGFGMI